MNDREKKDNQLFDKIAKKYGRKDSMPSSSIARKFQLENVLEFIKDEYGKEKFDFVLEIGCGIGATSNYMKGRYREYIGIDYSREFIKLATELYATENVRFYCTNIKEVNTPRSPDLIMGIGVLHHVNNIKKALEEISKISSNETIFAFIEPNSKNKFIQFLRYLRKKIDKSYSEDQLSFEKNELVNLFRDNGFDIVKTKYEGYFSPPFAQVILSPQIIFKFLSRLTVYMDSILQKFLDSNLAWNVMVITKKSV